MFSQQDDPIAPSPAPIIDGATQAWDPALWAAYLSELLQDERKRLVN
jgi:hypothetical protein